MLRKMPLLLDKCTDVLQFFFYIGTVVFYNCEPFTHFKTDLSNTLFHEYPKLYNMNCINFQRAAGAVCLLNYEIVNLNRFFCHRLRVCRIYSAWYSSHSSHFKDKSTRRLHQECKGSGKYLHYDITDYLLWSGTHWKHRGFQPIKMDSIQSTISRVMTKILWWGFSNWQSGIFFFLSLQELNSIGRQFDIYMEKKTYFTL